MPSLVNRPPSYRKHKATGQAIVTLSGRDIYLGPFGTKTSRDEYDRVIGEWLANGRSTSHSIGGDLTVSELIHRFWQHARVYYRKPDGTPTSEQRTYKLPLKILRRLYGRTLASQFGPLALEAIRNEMIARDWVRTSINIHIGRIKHMFKWAVSKELIPPSVHQALSTLSGLASGRSLAKESSPVEPVSDEVVEATLPFLSPTVAAMVRFQRLTACRPGEVCVIRLNDIDRSDPVAWLYRPASHKTAHRGHDRVIPIGRQAQDVLTPYLKLDPLAYCFSPAQAERERRDKNHAARLTPIGVGNAPGTNRKRKPCKIPRNKYDVGSYRRAISNGCRLAFPPPPPLVRSEHESNKDFKLRLSTDDRFSLSSSFLAPRQSGDRVTPGSAFARSRRTRRRCPLRPPWCEFPQFECLPPDCLHRREAPPA